MNALYQFTIKGYIDRKRIREYKERDRYFKTTKKEDKEVKETSRSTIKYPSTNVETVTNT